MLSRTDHQAPLPRVTFIIPALNAAGILENCLQSIRRQDYPQEKIEILVGDAGSQDGTRDLAKSFGALVVDDHGRNIEDGKRAALAHATGEYVVFIDADNEITHSDYIRRTVEALAANPTAFGVESYYLPSPRMTSFCAYLTCLLHISDPVAWMMSIKPIFLGAKGEVETWTFPKKSLAYPVGSNGFVFRKSELDLVKAGENYSDTHTSVSLIQATDKREWLRITGRGVHHYYVATLGEFLKKRRRATCHFLDMQKEHGFSWTERKPRIPGWLACVLCVTFIFPFGQMLVALARTRDARWLWHPWASFASALGVLWGLQTYFLAAKDKRLIAKLQPRQTLKVKTGTPTRTLLVYLHGIGDNIMLSGVLKEYCRRHPEESIDLIVLNSGCVGVWKGNPLVQAVTVYPFSQPHFWDPVKFYLAHQWKVRRHVRKLNMDGRYQRVLFPTIQTLPEIIYHLTGTYGRHKVDRLSADLGVPEELYSYDLHTSSEDAAEAEKLLQQFSSARLAVLHPFSGHSKKRISAQAFAKILDMLRERGLATLVVGAANEKSSFDPGWKSASVFGLSFGVLIEVLKRAKVFAGTDSTVAHLAAFANTPQIVILSTKLKPERYLPLSGRSRVITLRIKQGRENHSLEQFRNALEMA